MKSTTILCNLVRLARSYPFLKQNLAHREGHFVASLPFSLLYISFGDVETAEKPLQSPEQPQLPLSHQSPLHHFPHYPRTGGAVECSSKSRQ